jgi:hypothetical protein
MPYAPTMSGRCHRTTCREPATAAVALDRLQQVVWIGDPGADGAEMLLCERCAARLRPPRGWDRRDVRGRPPQLVVVPDAERPDDGPGPTAPLRPPPPDERRRLPA